MKIWLDAHLSPILAPWLADHFGLTVQAVRDVGLRDATDSAIFQAAREAGAVVMSKDADFLHLLQVHGPPPSVIWLTCGNTSNANLKQLLARALPPALDLLDAGETLVEIRAV